MNATKLQKLLYNYYDKKVIVVGTTCTGKSTLIKHIKNAEDMDKLVFPLLSKEESDYVCSTPWTKEIGETMTRLVKERVKVKTGHPLFGTVILDCDLIVYLNISNDLLKSRCKKRKVNFKDAKNMNEQIVEEIEKSKIKTIKFNIE